MLKRLVENLFSNLIATPVTKWTPFYYARYGYGHYMIFARLMSDGLIQFKTVEITHESSSALPFEVDTLQVLRRLCDIAKDRGIKVKKNGNVIKICRKEDE